jgi:hypothetical protein
MSFAAKQTGNINELPSDETPADDDSLTKLRHLQGKLLRIFLEQNLSTLIP